MFYAAFRVNPVVREWETFVDRQARMLAPLPPARPPAPARRMLPRTVGAPTHVLLLLLAFMLWGGKGKIEN
jgi:hypothetical protein